MFIIQTIGAVMLIIGCMTVVDSIARLSKECPVNNVPGSFKDAKTDVMISKISTVLGLVLICMSGSIFLL